MNSKQSLKIHICGTLIDDNDPVMLKELGKSSCRIYRKRCTCDDHKIALLNCLDSIIYILMLKILFIKDDVRSYDTAASVTMRNAFLSCNILDIELLTAIHAVVPENGTVKLDNALASCLLMEVVDILCDYSLKLALSLKSDESLVSLVRSCIRIYELTLIEVIEIFRMFDEKVMSNDIDRSVLGTALSVIDTCSASEIRDATFRGYTCSAKEHDIIGFLDQLLKLLDLVITDTAESVNPCFHSITSINEHQVFRHRQDLRRQDHRVRGTFRQRRTFPYR